MNAKSLFLKKFLALLLGAALLASCAPAPLRPPALPAAPAPADLVPVSASSEPAPVPADISLTEQDGGKTVHLEKGQTLALTLEGNPSTGYTWVVVPGPQDILVQAGEPEFIPQGSQVGASGKIRLRLRAESEGTQLLQLAYRRPWEQDAAPLRSLNLTVTVGSGRPGAALPAVTAAAYPPLG